MPRYVIERQYLLPIYEHLLIEAPSYHDACREAVDEAAHPWGEDSKQDFDNARPVTITQAVQLPDRTHPRLIVDEVDYASLGYLLYHSGLDPLPIVPAFAKDAEDEGAVGFS